MRIAMVSEHASPLGVLGGADAGGQNVHVAALAGALARRRVDVVVHTRRTDPDVAEWVPMGEGVTVHHVDAGPPEDVPKDELLPYMPAFAARLAQVWADRPPDVVHSHFWMSGHASLIAARRLGTPVVHTFHALGVVKRRYQGAKDTSPAERVRIEKDILRRADRIVPTCTDEVFELLRLGANHHRLTVIPCGVDVRRFTPNGPRDSRRPGFQRLVSLGRLVERKGVGNAIVALAELPGVELVVAGGPAAAHLDADPEVQRLRGLAEAAGVADRVQLRGGLRRHEVPALLRSADAVVCVPWYEPFGIVALEAMACGVPVVAAAVGGMIDTVVDGATGVHVPPRDPDRLGQAIRDLLADPRARAAYGRAGVERTHRLYDWDRVAAATLDTYSPLVRRRPAVASPSRSAPAPPRATGRDHLATLLTGLEALDARIERLEAWGAQAAARLMEGARLLAVGNGGSAAEAQHLTAELVGRYRDDRRALSALCLHADTSSLTAIANDYGFEEAFARQLRAHARAGDMLVAFSTSGRSPNVVAAARAARELGVTAWALTGPGPNPLEAVCDEAVCLSAAASSTVQELHLVAIHLLCEAVDREVARLEGGGQDIGVLARSSDTGNRSR